MAIAQILIVDDQEDNLSLLAETLEDHDFEVIEAQSGKEALEMLEEARPDVIILDIQMPGMDGLEACRRIKATPELDKIPIIFLTANFTDENHIAEGLNLGAYDYLTKPIREKELIARLNVMVRIKKAEDQMQFQSYLDPLTDIYNRRYLERRFNEEVSRARRAKEPLSFCMIDIDHFKSINDLYGHPFGDFVLKDMAVVLKQNLRQHDTVYRYGGEEFVMLLPSTNYEGAMVVTEKIRKMIQNHPFAKDGTAIPVTVSVGFFTPTDEEYDLGFEQFVSRADQALYRAKGQGRNQVVSYRMIYPK